MGWLSRLGILEPPARKMTSLELFREIFGGFETKSGQNVTIRTALETSTVMSAARVIAEGLAQVPCKLFQMGEKGSRTELRDHPVAQRLSLQPNDLQTAFEMIEQIGLHLALCGNAYVFKNVGAGGKLLELLPFEPGWMTVRREGYTVRYKVSPPDADSFDVPASQMWHIRGPSWSGYVGLDMVYQARNAIGMSLATEEFGSSLFANGARPGGILTAEQALDQEQVNDLRAAWQAAQGGSGNAMKTALLSGGLKFEKLSFDAEESQFTETRKLVVQEICRFMRVLPIMVMQSEDTTSYASVEQMLLAHLTHTLMPWYRRIEQSAMVNLLSPAERANGLYLKFMANAMMRGTAKERAEYLQIMRQNKVISANEWRDIEDMDRSDDPESDQLIGAVNLYAPADPAAASTE